MKRVLALHGHSQSAQSLNCKVSPRFDISWRYNRDAHGYGVAQRHSRCLPREHRVWYVLCINSATIFFTTPVFVDAPHILMPVDLGGEAADSISLSTTTINGCSARAWWRFLYDMQDVSTVVESFQNIQNVLETQGPFQVNINTSTEPVPCSNALLQGHYWIQSRRRIRGDDSWIREAYLLIHTVLFTPCRWRTKG